MPRDNIDSTCDIINLSAMIVRKKVADDTCDAVPLQLTSTEPAEGICILWTSVSREKGSPNDDCGAGDDSRG